MCRIYCRESFYCGETKVVVLYMVACMGSNEKCGFVMKGGKYEQGKWDARKKNYWILRSTLVKKYWIFWYKYLAPAMLGLGAPSLLL